MIWPVWLLVHLLPKQNLIRFGRINSERFGHLIANTEYFLRKKRSQPESHSAGVEIFFCGSATNRQVLRMIKRRIRVFQGRIALRIYHALRSWLSEDDIWIDLKPSGWQDWSVWNTQHPSLTFTPAEHRRGRALLAEMGVPDGAPFVCFHARDRAYLDAALPSGRIGGWRYHDFRDCTIENYIPAALWAAESGVWALRMGSMVETEIGAIHPRVIDYATRHRSDFGDIYLVAHCKCFIGNTAGLLNLAAVFNVPYLLANQTPLAIAAAHRHSLFIPKLYRDMRGGRILRFGEVIACGMHQWTDSDSYNRAGIEVIENGPDEILDASVELISRVDGAWADRAEDELLQEKYRRLFPETHPIRRHPSRVATAFLLKYRHLLD
ncbi:TIGR04372 family glycosyltransferase [bacterium]|nr:TIGR04372 family glycosyltransferase [bacterium]